ncbi:MAG: hypothetical protein J0H29_15130 [Sphingobacteriales bacterium]|nr:hypothetical protein [Sphingobacteriales bacterium]OJY87399.1 MAG: hypothetical protein BGP14_08625 [Sphingobacteriales bacterium 44-15]
MVKGMVLLSMTALLFSCGSGSQSPADAGQNNSSVPKSKSDSMYKAVMDGHDAAMRKMGEIARYSTLIKQYKDSLQKSGSKDALKKSALDSALQGLTDADEAMNKWMEAFDPDKAGAAEETRLAFYTSEKEKIAAVETKMDSSIVAAKKITGR